MGSSAAALLRRPSGRTFPGMHRALLVGLAVLAVRLEAQTQGVNAPAQRDKPYVILISFDGFRPEYLQRLDLPNFERIWRNGVRSTGMLPVFPSKTFPNHYSIATGMYAETHGLVGNRYWDPARGAGYSMSDTLTVLDGSWYRGEPIWVTAEKQGMVAASYFWVASEAAIGGVRPTFTKTFDTRVRNFARVDSVLTWLALPAERRPHMVTMYFSDTDGAAHDHGPFSPQLDSAAARVDSALGRLLNGVEALPLRDRVYFILVSDHGMSETSPRWYAALDTLIDLEGVRVVDPGPNVNLHVSGGRDRARALRDSINRRMRHGRAFLREEIPRHLRYSRDPRIGDIMVLMDDHFQVGRAGRAPREGSANHGWDPVVVPAMLATFVARGPGIPRGKVIGSFENVDIYPYITELLGLRPASGIDGKRGRLAAMIRRPPP
jgi:predicted AlkP superfamily pyrophosphatase or phosphodiesterase